MTHDVCFCGDHAWRTATCGLVAIMDVGVAPKLDAWHISGHLKIKSGGRIYGRVLARLGKRKGGTGKTILLARAILDADGLVDHKDNDPTNNRLSNLRPVTIVQSNANRRGTSKTGAKGVTYARNGYQACCASEYLGRFKTVEEAAEAYRVRATEKWGAEFVNTKVGFAEMAAASSKGEKTDD